MDQNDLYRINDVLGGLAALYEVEQRFDTQDKFDEWLNDLTYLVASEMGYKPPNTQKVI